MRDVSDQICRDNQKTYFMFHTIFFPKIVPFMR